MTAHRRRHCTCCGGHDSAVGIISWGGNCRRCGKALLHENVDGIAAKQGYAHVRRIRGYARWLERVILDDQRTPA